MPVKFRDFVPPVALSIVRKLRSRFRRTPYATYDQALSDCTERSYENADIVTVVVEKTKRYRDNLFEKKTPVQLPTTSAYSLCALLGSYGQNELNVLDFGGAAGAHYFLARCILPPSCRLNWIVVETPAMVERAAPVLSSNELRFTSDLLDAANAMQRIDLLHTSGTLQCVDRPYDYLQRLLATSAHYILFNRLGLTQGSHEVITIHESWLSSNGPGPMPDGIVDKKVRYPFVFPRASLFMEALSNNYETIVTFDDSSGIFPVDDEPIIGLGLLARRRA